MELRRVVVLCVVGTEADGEGYRRHLLRQLSVPHNRLVLFPYQLCVNEGLESQDTILFLMETLVHQSQLFAYWLWQ